MTPRNIHGDWKMHLEGRILYSKVVGGINEEATKAWFEEMKQCILSSTDGDTKPWVLLNDCTEFLGAALDSWEAINEVTDWECQHNCVLLATVISNKVQNYLMDTILNGQLALHVYFDYDEAYQACLEKLAEVQKSKSFHKPRS
ncbi:hypothetical protein L4C34_10320 [Vibrio profundum]|uniref:hypothetical protein n=1 Tax=Vibrio profundum TaxID=2910247 RepID=UPI003D0CE04B